MTSDAPMIEATRNTAAPPSRASMAARAAIVLALIALAIAAGYVLFKTPLGAKLQDHKLVHAWVHDHRLIAPLALIALYVLFAMLMLPVWHIQVAAGYCFGLVMGVVWCQIGAVIGGAIALLMSRWLVGQWFHDRYEMRIAKLRAIDEKLGHNGLFVVMGIRLCHLLPFGLSNYLFGLTSITVMDVIVGTLLGGIPAISVYVSIGAGVVNDWRLWMALGALNLVLVVPLALRYWKPDWFKKIGVE